MSWESLISIYREAVATREAHDTETPAACPNDGEPLAPDADGKLTCRFDGWQWDGRPIRYS